MKSERLKKLETELHDLEQWMKLGLVPKKELVRHKEEIANLQERIVEEKERLQFLKESGDVEEYTAPRRSAVKNAYPETPSMLDIEFGETTELGLDMDTESVDVETTEEEKEEVTAEEIVEGGEPETIEEEEEEDEEDPFSDRNRWRRGGIIDPDATEW